MYFVGNYQALKVGQLSVFENRGTLVCFDSEMSLVLTVKFLEQSYGVLCLADINTPVLEEDIMAICRKWVSPIFEGVGRNSMIVKFS